MAAQNPALTQLLTTLNAAPHPNMGMVNVSLGFLAVISSNVRM
jgi:hypothetical protein